MFWRRKPKDEPTDAEAARGRRVAEEQVELPVEPAAPGRTAGCAGRLGGPDGAAAVRAAAGHRPSPSEPVVPEAAPPAIERAGRDGQPRRRARPQPRRLHVAAARPVRRRRGPAWDDVEETLIAGDVGATPGDRRRRAGAARRDPAGAGGRRPGRARRAARCRATRTGRPARPDAGGPAIILVVGVNGTGKTTTIGKLAAPVPGRGPARPARGRGHVPRRRDRAAPGPGPTGPARRSSPTPPAPIRAPSSTTPSTRPSPAGSTSSSPTRPAACTRRSNLMDELSKIRRVIDRRLPGATPETLFVLDATTGQNGLAQARAFHEAVGLTGIVLTKLDSTAKGGIVFAIEASLGRPGPLRRGGGGRRRPAPVRSRRVRGGPVRLSPSRLASEGAGVARRRVCRRKVSCRHYSGQDSRVERRGGPAHGVANHDGLPVTGGPCGRQRTIVVSETPGPLGRSGAAPRMTGIREPMRYTAKPRCRQNPRTPGRPRRLRAHHHRSPRLRHVRCTE